MELRERVKKYKGVEKGPRRGLQKREIDGAVVYCFPNGIGVYKGMADISCEEVVERGKYTVVKLKKKKKRVANEHYIDLAISTNLS